ncbi:ArsR/SmtB family transcription factor [Nocardiopsis terrae]
MPERTTQERLADLEARVAELEQRDRVREDRRADSDYAERFFALEALRERAPEEGAVVFAGVVPGEGRPVEWQSGIPVDRLEGLDWSQLAGSLDALGNPVRLSLLHAVWSGVGTVAELKERAEFGTSGQIYHHVNLLAAAGWLTTRRRGHYVIPPERLIPLLVILAAARG